MTARHLLSLLALAALPSAAAAAVPDDNPFGAPPVADSQLATMRGGVRLPNGFDVAIGIDIQTRVNGALALQTVYASEGPNAGLHVYTGDGETRPLAPSTVRIETASGSARPTVSVTNGTPQNWPVPAGQTLVPVVANGPGMAGQAGLFSLREDDRGMVVTLDAPALQIRHLVGEATGVAVANTADSRTIDTVSAVNIDLKGVGSLLAPGIMAAERVMQEALRGR
ncbi:hypothetical protein CLG96_03235 [Sphingomonas oleivorans]|uniref:Uncharacterized protein n=1 Tax=Sphingomonas oleivorans TaxID=1735121 RepID=A0A2T5G1X3_9SPHN|nr:hypothetical protein [Sphingomonas oleivorans]PTQ13157.1 hypothetical protein CLG96_03235 [Sphingomonas oleivorans]